MALLSMGTNTGMQGRTASVQRPTANPQKSLSSSRIQGGVLPHNTVNPMDVRYSGGGGGGGGGGGNTLGLTTNSNLQQAPAYVDPYAAWGGTSAYNNLVSGFNTQKAGIGSSASDAATNSGIGLKNSILDFIDSLRSGQRTVDNRGINNELAKQRGVSDVYSSVSNGIRSGGVTLANRNASDSSASDRIAEAYSKIGQRQLSDVGNQYEMENQNISMAQSDLDMQRNSGLRRIESSEEQAVNAIVADASDKLAALDAAMANANLPERLALDAEKNGIRKQVMSILDRYDNDLGRANDIKAMALQGRVAEATRRGQLGASPEARFNFTSQMPTSLQGTGPAASELPIFTYRNNEE